MNSVILGFAEILFYREVFHVILANYRVLKNATQRIVFFLSAKKIQGIENF